MLHNKGLVAQLFFGRGLNNWHFSGKVGSNTIWIQVSWAVELWAFDGVIWFTYLRPSWVFTCLPENGNSVPLTHRFVFPLLFPSEQIDCTWPKATDREAHCVSQPHSYNHTLLHLIENKIYVVTIGCGGTQWRGWLRYCATNRKVASSIPDGVTGIFHWHNPSGRAMALGSTQPLTEMSTRNISWE
jgi:hypothetical protein